MTSVGPVGRTALYRVFDASAVLLYVGITCDPKVRWIAHAESQPWWPEVATFKLEWHDTRELGEAAERQAILAELPRWNIRDSPSRVVAGPNRVTVRVPDDVWEKFASAAEKAGSDRSTLIRDFILWYLAKQDAKLPERGAS